MGIAIGLFGRRSNFNIGSCAACKSCTAAGRCLGNACLQRPSHAARRASGYSVTSFVAAVPGTRSTLLASMHTLHPSCVRAREADPCPTYPVSSAAVGRAGSAPASGSAAGCRLPPVEAKGPRIRKNNVCCCKSRARWWRHWHAHELASAHDGPSTHLAFIQCCRQCRRKGLRVASSRQQQRLPPARPCRQIACDDGAALKSYFRHHIRTLYIAIDVLQRYLRRLCHRHHRRRRRHQR